MSDERIRVVRIFSRLNVGGPSIHVVLLTAGLDPDRFQTTLVVGREGDREGSLHALAQSKHIEPVVIPTLGRAIHPLRDLASLVALTRLLSRERPHIVHTHTAKAGALGRVAARLTGVPIVVHTFHGTVFSGYFGRFGSRVYATAERRLARLTDTIVAISPAVANELEGNGLAPRRSITTIPLGLDLDPFLRAHADGGLRERLRLPGDVKLLGAVGRLVPIKDFPTLLRAMKLVGGALPEVHLAIVGDGPERSVLEAHAKELGVSGRVHFLGFLSHLETVYPELDLVVNSSRNEGTPVALIEAMASGVPVVATAVGGSVDLLQQGKLGRLVPDGDPEALAGAIRATLSAPGARRKAERARRPVGARFGAERLYRDIERLYAELVSEKGLFDAPPRDFGPPLPSAPDTQQSH